MEAVTVVDAFAQLLVFEQRQELIRAGGEGQHSVNMAGRGRGVQRGQGQRGGFGFSGRSGVGVTRGRGRTSNVPRHKAPRRQQRRRQ